MNTIARYLLMAALCIQTGAQTANFQGAPDDAKSLDGATKLANRVFPCPEAKWNRVEQRFWRHHTVLKLTWCRWPHRPTIALDEQGSAVMLTDHVLRVSEKVPLNQFNGASKKESLVINARTAPDYLRFFLEAQLNWCDGLYFGDVSMAQKVKQLWHESNARKLAEETNTLRAELAPITDIPVTDSENGHAFKAIVFEWNPDGIPPAMQRHDITIHQDGTIDLNSEWIWRTAPTQ